MIVVVNHCRHVVSDEDEFTPLPDIWSVCLKQREVAIEDLECLLKVERLQLRDLECLVKQSAQLSDFECLEKTS